MARMRRVMSAALAMMCAAAGLGCAARADALVLEAAQGRPIGQVRLQTEGGVSFLTSMAGDTDGMEWTFSIDAPGFYDISVTSRGQGGHKENNLLLDGEHVGAFSSEAGPFAPDTLGRVYFDAGEHALSIGKSWGWIQVEKVELSPSAPLPEDIYDVSPVPVNPDASPNARRLMAYLCDQYGKKVITGQFCEEGLYGLENAAIWRTTGGQYPAMLGMDLIDYSPSRVANGTAGKTVDHALEAWDKGSIITLCWHWNAPEKYLTGDWYSGFYTKHTNIDLAKIMNGEDPEGYDLLLRDMDAIARELTRLRDADVPVLWRPLHEASGGWFWWGASGAEAYLKLYRLMFEKFTGEYGLNNLIWLWNGQASDWYPGDEYVDIIGEDVYPGERVYSSQSAVFLKALGYTGARKMIVLSENGCMPDPELLFRDGTVWGSYCTWEREFVLASAGFNKLGERYTEADMVKKIYADDRVIARADLPDLKTYPLPETSGEEGIAND